MKAIQKPRLHQDWIDPDALEIVETLQDAGFTTYLVGGCVRDLLLGIPPKDFDIATDARPQEVKRAVRNAYIIGKRFRLVLVKRGQKQFEIATFRRDPSPEELEQMAEEQDRPTDNLFGSPEEDACRRDFTINSLFYDPIADELLDFAKGMHDLEQGVVRMIGDPDQRLLEDPVRILRAIRLAHKIRFSIDFSLRESIQKNAKCLSLSALPRRREEYLKFLRLPDPALPFVDSYDLGVLEPVAPVLHKAISDPERGETFLHFVRYIQELPENPESPLELFADLVRSYVRSYIEPDPHAPLKAKELLEHEGLAFLMREEMGMFKYEQSLVAKALQMQSLLNKRDEFERKGEKRQMALLRNEAFPLALRLAYHDLSLNCEDLHFWRSSFEKHRPEIEEEQEKKRRSRSRRPRRPQRRGGKRSDPRDRKSASKNST
jgi:poly(A) polymerase